jgi:4a-hydroxytetrahydrobiopterin dehydratase
MPWDVSLPEKRDSGSRLAGEVLGEAVAALDGWLLVDGETAITKSFTFPSFGMAFAFMTSAALQAERMDHHPEWSNLFNRVDVRLVSHDAAGVTERDLALARYMDHVAVAFRASR